MLLRLVPLIAYLIIKIISKTLRLRTTGSKSVIEGKENGRNYIFAFWHNQFFVMPYYYAKIIDGRHISILTSLSKDGEYISRLLHKFGFNTVRGSSSYGGESALRLLIQEAEKGNDIAVTPDGPRGPRHKAQLGVITLASLTGCGIIPVGYTVIRKKVLNTWDRFIIPYPFSKGTLTIKEPIYVPKNISDPEKERFRKTLEDALLSISDYSGDGKT